MGWTAYHKDGTITNELEHGRPVQAGEDGELAAIVQEDFGHKIFVDLEAGVIVVDYENLDVQGGNIGVNNPRTILYVCDETNIVGELLVVKRRRGRPTKEGVIKQDIKTFKWRPIWFTRHTNEHVSKVIGLQTTLEAPFGKRNVKKMITLFEDGRIGID